MRYGILSALVAIVGLAAGCGGKSGGNGDPATSPVGTWVVDKDSYVEAMIPMLKEQGVPTEALDPETLKKGAAVEVEVKEGGTWTAGGSMGPKKMNESGSWKLDGDQLTIVWEMRDGKKDESPWTQTVTFEGDAFSVSPNENMPALRMIRK